MMRPVTDDSATVSWRSGRTRRLALVALWLGYAGVASGFRALTWQATVAVLIPAAAVVTMAARRPRVATETGPRVTRTLVIWAVLIVVGVVWEGWAFFHQSAWNIGSYTHPTLSTLLEPFLHHRLVRFGGWLVWLYTGWWFAKR